MMYNASQFAGTVNVSHQTAWLKYYMTGVTKCNYCVTVMLKDSVEYAFKHICEVFTIFFWGGGGGGIILVSVICATQI